MTLSFTLFLFGSAAASCRLILPLCASNPSYAYVFAIKDSIFGTPAPWVPPGAGASQRYNITLTNITLVISRTI